MSRLLAPWPHPFRLGREKPVWRVGTPVLGDHLDRATTWPEVKPLGWEYAVAPSELEMLGNDTIGICGPAGLMHWGQTATAYTDTPLKPTLAQTVKVYTAVTGYDPNAALDTNGNNPTDQGTNLQVLLDWAMQNGIPMMDKNGKEVLLEIVAYAALDIRSTAQMRYAAFLCGTLLGINLPQSAMDDLSNWLWIASSPVIGGHCVNDEGEGSAGGHIQTWAKNVPFTWQFMLNTLEEGWLVVPKLWVNNQTKAPSGLDLDGLLNAAKAFAQAKFSN